MPGKSSLKHKFIAFTGVYTLVLMLALFLYFISSSKNSITENSAVYLQESSTLISRAIATEMEQCRGELRGLATSIALAMTQNTANVDALIQQLIIENPHKFEMIALNNASTKDGEIWRPHKLGDIYSTQKRSRRLPVSTQTTEKYRMDIVVAGPQNGDYGYIIEFSSPIQSDSALVLAANVHFDDILERLYNRLSMPSNISLFFADKRGTIMDAPVSSHLKQNIAAVLPISPNNKKSMPFFDNRSMTMNITSTLATPQLTFALQQDLEPQIQQWRVRLRQLLFVSFLFFSAAMCVAWFVGRRFAASVRDVTTVAAKVAQGDFTEKLIDTRRDELGALFHTFNEMTTKLQHSYDELRTANLRLEDKIQELTETRKELSQKQRLALVGEALSKMSHEIQNKIGGVSIWVQNLERYLETDVNARDYIHELKNAIASFMEMLVHFKRFYRESVLARENTNISDILHESIEAVNLDIEEKKITISLDVQESNALEIDRSQIKDMLLNLLLNAVFYTPQGGEISIRSVQQGSGLLIQIQDQGPGVPDFNKELIFQPFFSTKSSGSGLGLAISQNIVIAHGGQIQVTNAKTGGAVFEILLPVENDQLG